MFENKASHKKLLVCCAPFYNDFGQTQTFLTAKSRFFSSCYFVFIFFFFYVQFSQIQGNKSIICMFWDRVSLCPLEFGEEEFWTTKNISPKPGQMSCRLYTMEITILASSLICIHTVHTLSHQTWWHLCRSTTNTGLFKHDLKHMMANNNTWKTIVTV